MSKLATHPLDVVKKRYQVAGLQRSLRYGQRIDVRNVQTLARSFRMVIRKEGLKGLWKGSLPNILKALSLPDTHPALSIKDVLLGWTSCCSDTREL